MSINLATASAVHEYQHAVTQPTRRETDRRMYRSPFGTTWRNEGTKGRLPERVGASIEVTPDGILVTSAGDTLTTQSGDAIAVNRTASQSVAALLAVAEDTVSVETPYWTASVAGLSRSIVTPVDIGYRVDLEWVASYPSGYLDTLVTQSGDTIFTLGGASIGVHRG